MASGIGTKTSDLDICLELKDPKDPKSIKETRIKNNAGEIILFYPSVSNLLETVGAKKLLSLPEARYPIIKCYFPQW